GHARTARAFLRQTEVCLDVEQIVLDAHQHGVERTVAAAVQAYQPEHGVDLVQSAVGGDPQVVFLAPVTRAQRSCAVVAGAGVDPVENDHGSALSAHHPDGEHYDHDRDELQQHAHAHELLALEGEATSRHVGR